MASRYSSYSRFLSRGPKKRSSVASQGSLSPSFLMGVAVVSFVTGAAMESFMIATGFYSKVTAIEADRRREAQELGPPSWVEDMMKVHKHGSGGDASPSPATSQSKP